MSTETDEYTLMRRSGTLWDNLKRSWAHLRAEHRSASTGDRTLLNYVEHSPLGLIVADTYLDDCGFSGGGTSCPRAGWPLDGGGLVLNSCPGASLALRVGRDGPHVLASHGFAVKLCAL